MRKIFERNTDDEWESDDSDSDGSNLDFIGKTKITQYSGCLKNGLAYGFQTPYGRKCPKTGYVIRPD